MFFVVLCPGAPEVATGSGSGLKRLRRQGRGLKSHPTALPRHPNQATMPPTPHADQFLIGAKFFIAYE